MRLERYTIRRTDEETACAECGYPMYLGDSCLMELRTQETYCGKQCAQKGSTSKRTQIAVGVQRADIGSRVEGSHWRLIHATAGYEAAGSGKRWTDGYWAVWARAADGGATIGRKYAKEADAEKHFARVIAPGSESYGPTPSGSACPTCTSFESC